jgi:hypothetical protein
MSDMGRRDFIALLGGAASHSKQTNDRAMSTLQTAVVAIFVRSSPAKSATPPTPPRHSIKSSLLSRERRILEHHRSGFTGRW